MEILYGQVKEVFIPNGEDELNPKNIGFKVLVSNKLLTITVPVDLETASILKDDFVNIIQTRIDEKTFLDIEKADNHE